MMKDFFLDQRGEEIEKEHAIQLVSSSQGVDSCKDAHRDDITFARAFVKCDTAENCYTVLFSDKTGGTHVGKIEYFVHLDKHGYALVSVLAPLPRSPLP